MKKPTLDKCDFKIELFDFYKVDLLVGLHEAKYPTVEENRKISTKDGNQVLARNEPLLRKIRPLKISYLGKATFLLQLMKYLFNRNYNKAEKFCEKVQNSSRKPDFHKNGSFHFFKIRFYWKIRNQQCLQLFQPVGNCFVF